MHVDLSLYPQLRQVLGVVQFEKWVNRDHQKIVQGGPGRPTPPPNVPLQEITSKDSKTMSKGMTNRRFEHNTFGGEKVYMLMCLLIDLQRTHWRILPTHGS